MGFDIIIEPADPLIFDNNADLALQGLNTAIAHCILPRITQYLWSYKRYKIRPAGGINPYDNPQAASAQTRGEDNHNSHGLTR
jgi:lauroyl/myristoyl acyltransferase